MKDIAFFCPIDKEDVVENADLKMVLSLLFLMKLGGQVSVSKADLLLLVKDYAGYVVSYNVDKAMLTVTMKVRPDEYPAPDISSGLKEE